MAIQELGSIEGTFPVENGLYGRMSALPCHLPRMDLTCGWLFTVDDRF
jgi:hypothetical protein